MASQKILHSAADWKESKEKIFNYDFLSLQSLGQSKLIKRTILINPGVSVSAECSILMKGNALKRTSLLVWASGDARVELFRLDSVVGGLSGFLGEAEEDDDKEATASVQLSLLGLPFRPWRLFSSFGELMNLYWSGQMEKLSSYLSKSIILMDRQQDFNLRQDTTHKV